MSKMEMPPPPFESEPDKRETPDADAVTFAKRTCLLVLGMHRSGTSALTRLLSLAGARLPLRLMPAGPGNESGHWEPLYLTEYHEKVLEGLGSSWHDWHSVDFSTAPPARIDEIKSRIKALIEEDYPDEGLYAVKDPRICRFAKFFIDTIEETGDRVALIHVFRSPLDVVNSLNSRKVVWPQGYTTTDAALLWLRHVLDAETACRGRRRALISFDSLMANPELALANIARQTGLKFEKSWTEIEPDVRTFLAPNQRHHAFSVADLNINPDTRGWVENAYLALRDLERDPDDTSAAAKIAEIADRFNEACPVIARVRTTAEAEATRVMAENAAEIERLKLELIEASSIHVSDAAEKHISSLKSQLADAERQNSTLLEEFGEVRRLFDVQSAEMLKRTRDLELQQEQKSQEILQLRDQIIQTELAYTTSTSWKVTRPLRAIGAGRTALRKAARFLLRADR